jgi:hypothetical protein
VTPRSSAISETLIVLGLVIVEERLPILAAAREWATAVDKSGASTGPKRP